MIAVDDKALDTRFHEHKMGVHRDVRACCEGCKFVLPPFKFYHFPVEASRADREDASSLPRVLSGSIELWLYRQAGAHTLNMQKRSKTRYA